MGETIAVALVIGSSAADHRPTSSPPATPCRPSSPTSGARPRAPTGRRCIGLAVTLFVITIVVNLIATPSSAARSAKSRGRRDDRHRSTVPAASTRPAAGPAATARLARGQERASSTGAHVACRRRRRASRSCCVIGHVVSQGRRRASAGASSPTTSRPRPAARAGHGPGGRRHDGDHRRRHADGGARSGILGAVYLNEYGGNGPLGRAHPLHVHRDDRRAVDRDGPVHLHDLGAASSGCTGFAGCAGPGLPDAADRHPLAPRRCCGSCPTTCARPAYALGQPQEPHDRSPSCCPPPCPASSAGCLLAVARAAGETAPLLFTIGVATDRQLEPVRGRQHRPVRRRSSRNATQPFAGGPGAGLGGGAHADRHRLPPHRRRPSRRVPLRAEAVRSLTVSRDRRRRSDSTSSRARRHVRPTSTTVTAAPTRPTVEPARRRTRGRRRRADRVRRRRPRRLLRQRSGPCATSTSTIRQQRDHRLHRPVGLRQDHGAALLQPHERPDRRRPGSRARLALPRRRPLRPRRVDAVEVRRRIGMVFQKPNPFPKSIYDNVAFGPRVNGVRRRATSTTSSSARCAARRCGTR